MEIATTDILVEGVHFNFAYTCWQDLGRKALAVNLSDIAAMGGIPAYALVSLALPGSTAVEAVLEMYEGMLDLANKYGVAICGGNISKSDKIIINITVTGTAKGARLLRRSASRPGDAIAITGYPGLSAAGLRTLTHKLNMDSESQRTFSGAHLRPSPRIPEALILVKAGIKCAIDTSDGLLSDLTHVCEASRVGATLHESLLPMHPLLKKHFRTDCTGMALAGGEDYELLFTGERRLVEKLQQKLECPVTIIGDITAGDPGVVTVLDLQHRARPVDYRGWDHYHTAH
jgi:thiamine-monophosphate kinase